MSGLDKITGAIEAALLEHPAEDVVSVVVGNFVGLMLALVEAEGGDPEKKIVIDGGTSRDITIHQSKTGGNG